MAAKNDTAMDDSKMTNDHEFKVGDRVSPEYMDGKGTITRITNHGRAIVEQDDKSAGHYPLEELELVESATVECAAGDCTRAATDEIHGVQLDGHNYSIRVCDRHFGPEVQ